MNKIFLFFAVSITTTLANAQSPYTTIQDSMYRHLDKSNVPTGVLYDRVYPWANLIENVAKVENDTIDFDDA